MRGIKPKDVSKQGRLEGNIPKARIERCLPGYRKHLEAFDRCFCQKRCDEILLGKISKLLHLPYSPISVYNCTLKVSICSKDVNI